MRILAIETAGLACSIALFSDDKLIAARHEELGRGHAEALIPWIADLPDGGRAEAIIVGCGPGSFTGVRVGIAAARALGLGWGVPVTGVSSIALVAASVDGGEPFLVAMEGGHGELLVQPFVAEPLAEAGPCQSLPPGTAANEFAQHLVIGSGAERLVHARGWGRAVRVHAKAAHVTRLPMAMRSLPPVPVYGRAPDAKPMAS